VKCLLGFRCECFLIDGADASDASVRAYDEEKRESVPVFIGVGGVGGRGFQRAPVFTVVGGDVGAVGV
jgi:hypothetical protein